MARAAHRGSPIRGAACRSAMKRRCSLRGFFLRTETLVQSARGLREIDQQRSRRDGEKSADGARSKDNR